MSRQPGALVGAGRTAEVYAWDDGTVLKLFRPEFPRDLAEREVAVTELAAASAEVAPRFLGAVEVDGRPGIVLERVTGPTLAAAATARPWLIVRYGHLLARLHLAMHRRSVGALPLQRELLGWAIAQAAGLPDEARRLALADLDSAADADVLCHGDFHPDNVVLSARGPVVIDWMTASRGDPLIDAARTSLLLSMGALPDGTAAWRRAVIGAGRQAYHALYLAEYTRAGGVSRPGISAWSLVVAAARMAEGIAEERGILLQRIEAEVRRRSGSRR